METGSDRQLTRFHSIHFINSHCFRARSRKYALSR